MCMCVYACECSVHRDQKGHHPDRVAVICEPSHLLLEPDPPSSVRATCALHGLAVFLPSKKVIFTLWVRVCAYHSLWLKVRWRLLRVGSLYCELQALNSGHQVHGKRVYLLSQHLEGPGHKHLNDDFNDRKKNGWVESSFSFDETCKRLMTMGRIRFELITSGL